MRTKCSPPRGRSSRQPQSSTSPSFDYELVITFLSLTQNRMFSMMESMRNDYDGMMVQTNQIYKVKTFSQHEGYLSSTHNYNKNTVDEYNKFK